jgi:hypothetical protein
MSNRTRLIGLTFVLMFASLALSPAATDYPPKLTELSEARYLSARELFDEAWLLYTRKGLSENTVYTLSVRLLNAKLDVAADAPGRIRAYQEHFDRIQKLQPVVSKLRGLGYSKKLEVKEIDYFVHEARYWLAREQAK